MYFEIKKSAMLLMMKAKIVKTVSITRVELKAFLNIR